ncbi:MAG TPA: hypothetical protein VGB87_21780, partial [Vicinamibacteria bacterium]
MSNDEPGSPPPASDSNVGGPRRPGRGPRPDQPHRRGPRLPQRDVAEDEGHADAAVAVAAEAPGGGEEGRRLDLAVLK